MKPEKKTTKPPVFTEAEATAPVGRPTKYEDIDLDKVTKLCLLGMTDVQLAAALDIATSTLYLWQTSRPEFSEAIKKGKHDADGNVVASLYKRAVGYEVDAIELKVVSVGGGVSEVEEVKVKKQVAPDPIAGMFWLKNRRPDIWRDKHDIQVDGELKINISFKDAE